MRGPHPKHRVHSGIFLILSIATPVAKSGMQTKFAHQNEAKCCHFLFEKYQPRVWKSNRNSTKKVSKMEPRNLPDPPKISESASGTLKSGQVASAMNFFLRGRAPKRKKTNFEASKIFFFRARRNFGPLGGPQNRRKIVKIGFPGPLFFRTPLFSRILVEKS